ncbi:MAG: hypothetical protein ACE5NJ_09620, partial [Thermodesulfobacteriota bacterium]
VFNKGLLGKPLRCPWFHFNYPPCNEFKQVYVYDTLTYKGFGGKARKVAPKGRFYNKRYPKGTNVSFCREEKILHLGGGTADIEG